MLFRLFAMPLVLFIVGQGSAWFLLGWASKAEKTVLLDLAIATRLVGILLVMMSLIIGGGWLLSRLYKLHLWRAGRLKDGCFYCNGLLSHHDDDEGFYSKCLMCNTRQR
ncbi:hypothetical protein IQ22_03152 [Pseudomonas duriflava]|uniref:Uncharacterized protein n=1 Tax=Pseudomonas duriflava TaxID=459528 RepID=A0A562Q9S8_9PSED|nr:hypothetical protein [Pseudomonas duriflava]TWI52776.1 hypothetical protein IQ22_03152 [Pseudomonas duriflava]